MCSTWEACLFCCEWLPSNDGNLMRREQHHSVSGLESYALYQGHWWGGCMAVIVSVRNSRVMEEQTIEQFRSRRLCLDKKYINFWLYYCHTNSGVKAWIKQNELQSSVLIYSFVSQTTCFSWSSWTQIPFGIFRSFDQTHKTVFSFRVLVFLKWKCQAKWI